MLRLQRMTVIGMAMTVGLMLGAAPVAAEDKPSGTIDIEEFDVAYLGELSLGHGTLDFNGHKYRFKVGGLGVGGAGISKISAEGHVYKLKDIGEFAGEYAEGRAGIVVGDESTGELWLKNDHGVVLRLKAKREGLMLSMGATAITIELEK